MKINKLGVYKMKKETDALFKNDEFLVTGIDHLNGQFYTPAIGAWMPWDYPAKFLGEMNPPNVRDHRAGPSDQGKAEPGDVAGSGESTCWAPH
jgi:hypothetical protein